MQNYIQAGEGVGFHASAPSRTIVYFWASVCK